MKLAIHITYYHNKNISNQTGLLKKNKIFYLKKVISSYQKLKINKKIFIHTNKKNILKKKFNYKNLYFKEYNLKNQNPRYLPWKCRDLINKQLKKFDLFIYTEDDLLFTQANLDYWLNYKNIIQKNYNLGFMRYEMNKRIKYLTDIIKPLFYYTFINKKKYIVNNQNPNCSFWIMDRNELTKFSKTQYWKFNWSGKNYRAYYDPEIMSAIGWHGLNMDRYIATVVPFIKNKIPNGCFVHHLPNNYAGNKKGFGSLKLKKLVSRNTIKFNILIEKLKLIFLFVRYHFRFLFKIFKT